MAPFLLFFVTILTSAEAKSTIVRTLPVHYPALYPESLTWDDELGIFISGSLARGALFSITHNGTVEEFIRDPDYTGIAATVGVAADPPRRRILTVVNNVFDHPSSFHGLAAYDLDTKTRLFLSKFDPHACPNDVAVDPASGAAYVTDSARDLIIKVSPSGESSIFAQDPIFTSQPIVAIDPPAVRSGLNGIAVAGDYLLLTQTKSGKLFRVGLRDTDIHIVDIDSTLMAADGIRVRQDGMLIVVSTDVLWVVKSRDHWKSAYVIDEVTLDRSLNSTSLALQGPKDNALIVHAHFQDLFTVAEKGMAGLPGGEFRSNFSFLEVKLPKDPDNDPLWLLLIVVLMILVFGGYKLQMKWWLDKYNRSIKRD